jgi:asparagine synthase (glutamine-hydrolysing)
MCGIAGIVGPYERHALTVMTECMHHRGPDETGYLFLPGDRPGQLVGMGHKRLSIIDLSSGQQPMANEDESLHVVFNGEIYNHRAVRQDLLQAGHRFASQCDTEVLLHGYEEYSTQLLERLEGMFAFGLWHQPARRWFLARDRFGIKPLYFCQPTPTSFAFASEIKPLLPLVGGAKLHLEALYHYLLYGWASTDETIFRGIFHLRPAHWLTWNEGKIQQGRYWSLQPGEDRLSEAEWAERLREQLEAAVRSHLIADVPVGITLSGGLDSSTVLALMARAMPPEQIQAFTVGYGLANDELPYARQAARHMGVQTRERVFPIERVAEAFERILWHLEEPIAHPILGTTYFLAEFVRQHVKVAMIGEGSDELFAGYPHFHLFRAPYSWAPKWLTRRILPGAAFVMPDTATLAQFLHPDMLDRGLLEHVAHAYDDYLNDPDLARGWLRCELEHELVASQLARIDKLTMAHSVEARVPFLDRQLVETAFRIPFALKMHNGVEKAILRKSMQDLLPRDVLHRPKSGPKGTQNLLPVLLDQVLRNHVAELTHTDTMRRRGWFRSEAVGPYLARADSWLVRKHPIDSRRRAKFLFALATLEQWARLFLDGQRPAATVPCAA